MELISYILIIFTSLITFGKDDGDDKAIDSFYNNWSKEIDKAREKLRE